ncbi:MAG: sensor histidine kinase [Desulfobacteraceae bacterium]
MKNNLSEENLLDEFKKKFDEKNILISELKSELEITREKLYDSEHLKTKFLSIIRNELKNPVSAISGLSKLVAQKDFDSVDEIKNILKTIRLEAVRFSLQLDNVLAASSFEGGDNNLFLSVFDLEELINDVKNSYSDETEAREKEIYTEFKESVKIYADREKIKLAFKNIFDNAVKFSEKTVKINVFKKNNNILISFFNDGYEIQEKDHHKVFDRFNPINSGLSRKHCGVGLGLCVCSAVIDAHGGKIDFFSGKGSGTVFQVELPLDENQGEGNDDSSDQGFVIL